ncbi:MAG: hypothetical protein KY439_12375, partial [Actinobacteria bacterium]|nr:hypothetical protein [Actinomycetota bacterium]
MSERSEAAASAAASDLPQDPAGAGSSRRPRSSHEAAHEPAASDLPQDPAGAGSFGAARPALTYEAAGVSITAGEDAVSR